MADYFIALGENLIASTQDQLVMGKNNNIPAQNAVLIVGNGDDEQIRQTTATLFKNGDFDANMLMSEEALTRACYFITNELDDEGYEDSEEFIEAINILGWQNDVIIDEPEIGV